MVDEEGTPRDREGSIHKTETQITGPGEDQGISVYNRSNGVPGLAYGVPETPFGGCGVETRKPTPKGRVTPPSYENTGPIPHPRLRGSKRRGVFAKPGVSSGR